MSTLTPNFDFVLPGVGDPADQDLWGGYLNANWSSLDSLLKTATDRVTRAVTVTGTVTLADLGKLILVDATAANVTLTIDAAATVGDGFWFVVKKTDATANTVTVTSSDNIDGSASIVMADQNESHMIASNASDFYIMASKKSADFATNSESNTGTAVDVALTPANFGTQNSLVESGYQRLPGGLIMQWGKVTNIVGTLAVVFPIPFTTTLFTIQNQAVITVGTPSNEYFVGDVQNETLTGFDSSMHVNGDANPVSQYRAGTSYYFALGK
jgi:hypothetical protein